MKFGLTDKVAIVTGAGSGIGRASAIEFAALGAKVVVADINQAGLDETVATITGQGNVALGFRADVTNESDVKAMVDFAVAEFGGLDVLFNNAGGSLVHGPAAERTLEEVRAILELNLVGTYAGVKYALPIMMKQGRGSIISTTSGGGIGAVEDLAPYGAAKAGVIALMRSIALEYGRYGIRANAISPGPTEAPGFRKYLDAIPGGDEYYISQVPQRRLGQPEDLARAAAFLASDYSEYVNGITLPVDGGTTAKLATPVPKI